MDGLVPLLATAALLGLLHGIEPDHAAGITALASAFTLSPPLSMMAFLSAVVLSQGLRLVLVLPYALAILLSMGLVGAGIGALSHYLQRGRVFTVFRATVGVLIIGYAVTFLL